MKAKLIRMEGKSANMYELLCMDGTKKLLKPRELADFFCRFRDDEYLSGGKDGSWMESALDMSETGGDMVAYVTSSAGRQNLVVVDPGPFASLFEQDTDDDSKMIPISEYAKMYGVTPEIIKVYCREGRITGAYKAGRQWLVPKGAVYPTNLRMRAPNRTIKTTVEN